MIRNISLVTLIALLLLWGCEKINIPDPVVEGIPFELSGVVGGEPFNLGIENPDFILRTDARFNETDTIWEYSGQILPRPGIEGPSLHFGFRPGFKGRTLLQNEQSVFAETNWQFFVPGGRTIVKFPFSFSVDFSDDSIELKRYYLENRAEDYLSSNPLLLLDFEKREEIRMCVDYLHKGRNEGSFCTHIPADHNGQLPMANWGIYRTNNNNVTLSAVLDNFDSGQLFFFNWGEGFQKSRMHEVNSVGLYTLEVKDEFGRKYSQSKKLIKNNTSGHFETYGNEVSLTASWQEPEISTEQTQIGSFRIFYTDSNGEEWRLSENQEESAYIRILDSREFSRDALGKRTYALKIELKCQMVNRLNEQLEVDSLGGWIAVGIPEN